MTCIQAKVEGQMRQVDMCKITHWKRSEKAGRCHRTLGGPSFVDVDGLQILAICGGSPNEASSNLSEDVDCNMGPLRNMTRMK